MNASKTDLREHWSYMVRGFSLGYRIVSNLLTNHSDRYFLTSKARLPRSEKNWKKSRKGGRVTWNSTSDGIWVQASLPQRKMAHSL
jgi:hypothetical protein